MITTLSGPTKNLAPHPSLTGLVSYLGKGEIKEIGIKYQILETFVAWPCDEDQLADDLVRRRNVS